MGNVGLSGKQKSGESGKGRHGKATTNERRGESDRGGWIG